jgi:Winged helix-turn helix
LVQAKVIQTWQRLSRGERKEIRRRSMRASDAVMRCRCKIILSLVQGKTPTMIAQGGLCAKSQVYRVADRFIEHGLVGLADKREDNGENKVTDVYGMELLGLLEGSPRDQGQRPLNRCSNKDFEQVVFVPATTSTFHDQAGAAGMLLQE